jgi:hypothetical protein
MTLPHSSLILRHNQKAGILLQFLLVAERNIPGGVTKVTLGRHLFTAVRLQATMGVLAVRVDRLFQDLMI